MKKTTINNTLTTMEDLKSYIISCLPTFKKDLFETMDKKEKESLNNDYLILYLQNFEDITLKDENNKVNQKALNTLYALDSIIAFEDYAKDIKETFVKNLYVKFLEVYNIDATKEENISQCELLKYNIELLFNDIVKKAKKSIDETKEIKKSLSILLDNWTAGNYEKVDIQTKELFNLTFSANQKEVIFNGFINANKYNLGVKGNGFKRNLLLAILRNRSYKHGLYSRKKVCVEISDIMKNVKFLIKEDIEEKCKTDIGVKILAKDYDIQIKQGKDFNFPIARDKVLRVLKRDYVLISSELNAILDSVKETNNK